MQAAGGAVESIGVLASSDQPVGQPVWWKRRWLIIVAAGLVACLLIFLRRPDALLNPQFLAEDGYYYYAQAYNLGGLRALLLPVVGYFLVSDRLVALVAVLFPVAWGPAIFNVCGILMQVAPVAFLLTRRFDHLLPNWYARGAIALLYLAIPNSYELDASVTYLQWHLALLAFLVVIAAPRAGRAWKVFDGAVLLLCGMSGPYCFALAPVILLRWLRTRDRQTLILLAIDLVTVVAEALELLENMSTGRAHNPLGVSIVELARIVGGQLFLAATLSSKGYLGVSMTSWWASSWFPILVSVCGVGFVVLALRRAPQELRLLWLFGALIFCGALISPMTPGPGTAWERLAHPVWNLRYEFTLNIAWLTTLVWTQTKTAHVPSAVRHVALVLLTLTCLVGIPLDWQYPAFTDDHYQAYVQRFEQLPPGSHFEIPLNPGFGGWTMTLIKR
ncbi:MAG TPA: hypothetical protein VHI51_15285 [Ktedonobacterales bacterium]|jgi:hypothetical protein|nr:hypothetical protein [Ktedonobacterales bacterium]